MTAPKKIDYILEFPEGDFLIVNNAPYFMPQDSDKAYMGWGARKELMGKIHHEIGTQSDQFEKFDLTYEVEDDSLIAARLITPFSRSAGKLGNDEKIAKLESAIEDGSLELMGQPKKPFICRAANFEDGRTILLMENIEEGKRHTLLVGTPNNYEKVEITNGVQGGCSFYYQTEDKQRVEFPYGFGGPQPGEPPMFGDEELTYIDVKDETDFEAFGVEVNGPEPHLDPFFDGKQSANKPKAPGQ